MMRSGKLDRTITIQAPGAATVDAYGSPTVPWTDLATVRAELVETSTEEFLRAYGETGALAVVFRIRWLDGVTTDQRVTYEGRTLLIKQVSELGRRRGLELRCDEVRR